jgi:hypothetical protein
MSKVEKPTLEAVESMLDEYIDLSQDGSVVEALDQLSKTYFNLLLATSNLEQGKQEQAKFLFTRIRILESCISIRRQRELYDHLKSGD